MLAVTGDLTRNSVYVVAHNGVLGYPVAKRIAFPKNLERMLEKRDK
jgi:hypothetical protein